MKHDNLRTFNIQIQDYGAKLNPNFVAEYRSQFY